MPEGVNAEVARHLNEKRGEEAESRSVEIIEIFEALILAFVTIATAWSGYQAARWDGKSALYYGQTQREHAQANKLATLGVQQRLYDITTLDAWLQAESTGNAVAAALFQRRFSPAYRVAFDAWLKTNPLHNSHAPRGPSYMRQYRNAALERSDTLEARAESTFERAAKARETSDDYVRVTVFLASILFLIAIAQRFKVRNVHRALLGAAFLLLVGALFTITTLPLA
jgi:hypothetical protein